MRLLNAISRRAILALLSLVPYARTALAGAGVVGAVSRLAGTPTVKPVEDSAVPATRGMTLHLGDTVVTGPGGRLEIRETDGSTIIVGEDTTVVLKIYVTPASAGVGSAALDLLEGILRMQLPVPWNRFEVTTATALASVRSTDWLIDAKADNTAVFVAVGGVEVVNSAVTGAVLLEAGFGTDVKAGALPTTPKRWSKTRVDAAMTRTRIT